MNNTAKKNRELTLLQAIERVVEMAEDSKMSPDFMKKANYRNLHYIFTLS